MYMYIHINAHTHIHMYITVLVWYLEHILSYLLCVMPLMFCYLEKVDQNEYVMLQLILKCTHDCVVKVLKSY